MLVNSRADCVDFVEKDFGPVMQPIFISCDPARDTVEQTAAYVKGQFHSGSTSSGC